jgi:integrase
MNIYAVPLMYCSRRLIKSLETTKKGLAQQGKVRAEAYSPPVNWLDLLLDPRIEIFFSAGLRLGIITSTSEPILPKFKNMRFLAIGTGALTDFRADLLRHGLSVKTARNVIYSSFRAMYRDARAEIEELKEGDPFIDIQWPKAQRTKPDPFTAEERDKIVEHWTKADFFYFPWVFTLFHTGMRPSEASALTWADVDLEHRTILISKSRYMGRESAPKTSGSSRIIQFVEPVANVLKSYPRESSGSAMFL